MTTIEKVCDVFNLEYFDFFNDTKEQNIFDKIIGKDKKDYRSYLEFYSRYDEFIDLFRITYTSSTDEKIYPKRHKNFNGTEDPLNKEYYNIGDNFYIGHFFFDSLLFSSKGEEACLEITELNRKHITEHIRKLYSKIEESGIKNNREIFKKELQKKVDLKYIISYNDFLEKYEYAKETDITYFRNIFGGGGTTKSDYLKFLFSHSKPTQNLFKKKLEAFIPNKARYRNTYIVGQAGSGKSELIKGLIFSILRTQQRIGGMPENFILLDPHGDLANDIYNLAAKYQYDEKSVKTILLDPFLEYDKTPIINPFDFEGTQTELNSYTEELLNVFREILGTDFTLNAESILIPCISTLLKIENTSLYDLQRFMNDEENEDLVTRGKITKNIAHKTFFESGFYLSNLNSTKRAIFLKIQILLNNQTFSNLTTGKTTINLDFIMNNYKNLIIKLNKQKMRETLSPFGRFIIAKIQSIALKRADIPENHRHKTHFFIDEFQNFVSPTTEEILTESRKYKLFLTLAHQVISQIEESKTRDIILSNTFIKLVGQNGQKTLGILSKELGVKTGELENLKTGEFFARIGKNPAFKMYHQMLDFKFYKSTDFTKECKRNVVKECYVKPVRYKPPVLKTDRNKDFVNQIITDKHQKSTNGENPDITTPAEDIDKQNKEQKQNIRVPKFKDF